MYLDMATIELYHLHLVRNLQTPPAMVEKAMSARPEEIAAIPGLSSSMISIAIGCRMRSLIKCQHGLRWLRRINDRCVSSFPVR